MLQCNAEVMESNCTEFFGDTEIENSEKEEANLREKGKAIDYCIEKLEALSQNPKEQIATIKEYEEKNSGCCLRTEHIKNNRFI